MSVVLFFFFFSSRRRHTRCALVTGVQTCALPICDPQKYRNADELKAARENDPLARFRKSVTAAKLLDEAELDAIDADVKQSVVDSAERALAAPMPSLTTLTKDVYVRYRSEEHTSELQSLMRISYAVFCLKTKNTIQP